MTADYYAPGARLARAARERAASGWSWENDQRRRRAMVALVLAVKGRTCHLCGRPGATTADHVVPRSQGGRNVLENLEPAHPPCNYARGDTDLAAWFASHPVRRPSLPPSRRW